MNNVNPLAKLLAAFILGFVLLLSLDPVSSSVALVLEIALLPFSGLSAHRLWRSLAPVLIAAPFAGIATLLWGRGGGELLWAWGPWTITSGNLELAITVVIRVVAVVLPSVILFASTDPTDLADALAQLWKLPVRFVYGALAAIRQLSLMGDDWRMLSLTRRARGIAGARNPVNAVRALGSRSLSFMVIAIRRGSLLATAMEARGFDSDHPRTWARTSLFTYRDGLFVVGAALIAAIAVTAAVLMGEWNFVIH